VRPQLVQQEHDLHVGQFAALDEPFALRAPYRGSHVQRLGIGPVERAARKRDVVMVAAGCHGGRRGSEYREQQPLQDGLYQIGEVHARSCVVIGTSFAIFTLK
jgi:hypothetical protein